MALAKATDVIHYTVKTSAQTRRQPEDILTHCEVLPLREVWTPPPVQDVQRRYVSGFVAIRTLGRPSLNHSSMNILSIPVNAKYTYR